MNHIPQLKSILNIPEYIKIDLYFEDLPEGSYVSRENENHYSIYIENGLNEFEILKHQAHEVKHVQQMVDGIYFPYNDYFVWHGDIHFWREFKDGQQPHEIDATYFENSMSF